jgi:hypothetical protein
MSFFKDTNGREWRIRLTGPAIGKVREATGITLADPSGRGAVAACADGEILTRVLWLLCGEQEPKLTPEQFGEAVASGEVFDAAREALQAAIVDFTPPSQRPMLQKVLETERAEQAARAEVVMEKITGDVLQDQVLEAFRVGLDKELAKILTRLRNAGNSPDSQDLTPIPQPYAN